MSLNKVGVYLRNSTKSVFCPPRACVPIHTCSCTCIGMYTHKEHTLHTNLQQRERTQFIFYQRSNSVHKVWFNIFHSAKGVPRHHRGEIWKFLAEQFLLRHPFPSKQQPKDVPYKELLKKLTSQQHAILIDLGESAQPWRQEFHT